MENTDAVMLAMRPKAYWYLSREEEGYRHGGEMTLSTNTNHDEMPGACLGR